MEAADCDRAEKMSALVDGFECASDREVVLELDGDALVCERLED